MKIAIMGAGGIGALYGGRMARAGEDVWFIARGAHLAVLQEEGLRIESKPLGDFTLTFVKATDDPAEVGQVDLIFITTKGYDLEQASLNLLPMIGPETVVIPLLNGVEIAEQVGAVVGMKHMMGGIVNTAAFISEPGVIRHVTADHLAFGELEGGDSERGRTIEEMMVGADIPCDLSVEIGTEIWTKFLRWTTAAGICALTRCNLGTALADRDVSELALACMEETEAIARHKGVNLPDGFSRDWVSRVSKGNSPIKPSLLLDLERGRKLELDLCQGAILRLGSELGVPTPVNRFIFTALKLHADGVQAS
jgi:2-dehydropantoate 2-reductase